MLLLEVWFVNTFSEILLLGHSNSYVIFLQEKNVIHHFYCHTQRTLTSYPTAKGFALPSTGWSQVVSTAHVAAQHKFGSAEVVVHQLLHVQWPPEQECYQEKQKLSSMHTVRFPLPAVSCNGMDVGSLCCYKSSIPERGVSLKIHSKWSKSHRVPSLTSVYLSQLLIAHFAGKHKRLSFN